MRHVVFMHGSSVRVFVPATPVSSDAELLARAAPVIPPDAVRRCFDAAQLPEVPAEMLAWDGTEKPPVVSEGLALASAKSDRIRAIRAASAARIAAGMAWQGKTLQIDAESCGLLTAADAMGNAGGLLEGFAWRMADNSFLPLDAAGLHEMALAAGTLVYAIRATTWSKVDAVRGAVDLAGVEAVDPAAGWPE